MIFLWLFPKSLIIGSLDPLGMVLYMGVSKKAGALIQTPNSRGLFVRTPKEWTPICRNSQMYIYMNKFA